MTTKSTATGFTVYWPTEYSFLVIARGEYKSPRDAYRFEQDHSRPLPAGWYGTVVTNPRFRMVPSTVEQQIRDHLQSVGVPGLLPENPGEFCYISTLPDSLVSSLFPED